MEYNIHCSYFLNDLESCVNMMKPDGMFKHYTPFSGSQMSLLENGGGILHREISENIATVKFWAIYLNEKYVLFVIQ